MLTIHNGIGSFFGKVGNQNINFSKLFDVHIVVSQILIGFTRTNQALRLFIKVQVNNIPITNFHGPRLFFEGNKQLFLYTPVHKGAKFVYICTMQIAKRI